MGTRKSESCGLPNIIRTLYSSPLHLQSVSRLKHGYDNRDPHPSMFGECHGEFLNRQEWGIYWCVH